MDMYECSNAFTYQSVPTSPDVFVAIQHCTAENELTAIHICLFTEGFVYSFCLSHLFIQWICDPVLTKVVSVLLLKKKIFQRDELLNIALHYDKPLNDTDS